jgi:hypothetical protein
MRYVLEQLIGETVTLSTTVNPGGEYNNATINSVSTGLLNITVANDDITVSICHIAGVAAPEVRNVELLQPPLTPRTGDCACCETPWRVFFDSIIGYSVDVVSEGIGSLDFIQNAEVLSTGEGIVILDITSADDVAALSLCKIKDVSDVTAP